MKTTLNILKTIAAATSAVAALDLTGIITILPPDVAKILAVGLTVAATVYHAAKSAGDILDDGQRNNSFLPLLIVCGILAVSLPSCTPTMYEVDTTTYVDEIKSNPSSVMVKPEHVKEIGGFQGDFGVRAITDYGEVDLSPDGLRGDVVIDLRNIQVTPTK